MVTDFMDTTGGYANILKRVIDGETRHFLVVVIFFEKYSLVHLDQVRPGTNLSNDLFENTVSKKEFRFYWNSWRKPSVIGTCQVGRDTNTITLEKSLFGSLLFSLNIEGLLMDNSTGGYELKKREIFKREKLKRFFFYHMPSIYSYLQVIEPEIAGQSIKELNPMEFVSKMRQQGTRLKRLPKTKDPLAFLTRDPFSMDKHFDKELNQDEIDELLEFGLITVSTNNRFLLTENGEFVKENFEQELHTGRLLR